MSTARIDDLVPDTVADNLDAVQVQQEIQRLAIERNAQDAGHVDDNGDDEAEDDSYLEQYELDSDEEDELLRQMQEEDTNIGDEDWEVADGDFTKMYNRMRQHQKVLTTLPVTRNGTQGILGAADTEADMPLPARNVRKMGGTAEQDDNPGSKGLTARQRRAIERRNNAGQETPEQSTNGPASTNHTQTQTQTQPQTKRINKNPLLTAPLLGVPSAPKHFSLSANQKDKADRATVEQVLDSRTRAVLVSLIRKGLVGGVQGCVSTGKEANVYFAPGPEEPPLEVGDGKQYPKPYPKDLALKIYKTSILSFKSRSQYIQGEHRFRNAYTKVANPRKMVKVWAEKELRNLRRLEEGGVRCPKVVDVRENVLVMEFLGNPALATPTSLGLNPGLMDGSEGQGQDESESSRASKRLKDADVDREELRELYAELLVSMRWMFRRCKLVHTDLSEYNILYHDSHLYIIDVSQSVEHEHPSAFDFLRHDIKNIDEFFKRRSGGDIRTLGIRGTFDFIVNDTLKRMSPLSQGDDVPHPSQDAQEETEESLKDVVFDWIESGIGLKDEKLETVSTGFSSLQPREESSTSQREMDEAVFMSSYIPRNLAEVYDPERDIDVIASGKGDELIYAGVTGVGSRSGQGQGQVAAPKSALKQEVTGHDVGDKRGVKWEDEAEESSQEDSEEDDENEDASRQPRGFRHEDKDAKKERKKAIKEEKREKRQTKMPKAEKQRRIKQTAHSK